MFRFNKARWLAFGAILGLVYFLAVFGVWLLLPGLGDWPFMAGLMIWYVPGVLFEWTGWFAYHAFGASPTGWPGHLLMFLFYAAIAFLLSWPFGRLGKRRSPAAADEPPA